MSKVEARATLKYLRQGPRKVRLMADIIRGKKVEDAINILHFSKKRASKAIEKTVRSAISNILNMEGGDIDTEHLFVKEIFIDGGPSLKRFRPRARGRATKILKRTCHMTVVVATDEVPEKGQRD